MSEDLEWAEHDARAWLTEEILYIDQRAVIGALLATIDEIRNAAAPVVATELRGIAQDVAAKADSHPNAQAGAALLGVDLELRQRANKLDVLIALRPDRPEED